MLSQLRSGAVELFILSGLILSTAGAAGQHQRRSEVQKYCSMTNRMWDGLWLLGNRRAWDRLPKDVQEIAARELNQSALDGHRDLTASNFNVRGVLSGKGPAFNDLGVTPFRQTLQKAGYYAEWKRKYGEKAWGILETLMGGLA